METLNVTNTLRRAREQLRGKQSRKLAAFHTGISVGAALVVTGLQYVLAEGIGKTGGLSGLGTRSLLETVQVVLQWANMLLAPFWGMGFLYAALRWARGETPKKEDLLMGFRRIGPFLGLMANRILLTIAVVVFCSNISSMLFMMTPAGATVTELFGDAVTVEAVNGLINQMSAEQMDLLIDAMLPLLVLCGLLCAALLIPLLYRFRFAEYAILNQPGVRGLSSMVISAALLRRRCWQLFKLDLKLWWYHGLKALCTVLCYGDLLLAAAGIGPVGEYSYLVFYLLYLAGLFAVDTCFRPQAETAYACAYETLMEMGPVPRKSAPQPAKMPWDEP